MKKAYLTGLHRIEIREVPDPKIVAPDDVLIHLDAIGVCGSDLHYYRDGRIGEQVVKYPFPVGHECAGTVLAVGPKARLSKGQRVAIDPLVACGQCDQCKGGRENTCRNQKFLGCPGQLEGSTCDLLVMPAGSVMPIPDGMSFDLAVMAEPFAIGLWAVKQAVRASGRKSLSGAKVAVLGCGPIGLCVMQALRAEGQCTIYATDLRPERVELARRTGAAWAGCAAGTDPVADILKQAPLGVDIVIECAGEQETIDQAGKVLTPGGTLAIVGIPPVHRLSFDMNYYRRREITIQNVRRQNGCAKAALDLIAAGKVDLAPQVTHHYPLSETQAAFDLVADYRDNVVKAIINP